MPLNYQIDGTLQRLAAALDEHADWYGRVIRHAFYAEEKISITTPTYFNEWAQEVRGEEYINISALTRLMVLHNELHAKAATLMMASMPGKRPSLDEFDSFSDLYDEFILLLRRFERDCVMEDSGHDVATGLRSRRVMRKDLDREMERRARQGKAFSIAIVKVDRYDDIRALQDDADHGKLLMTLADMIRKSLRSFDDAYYSGEGEFIMSLKHADISGGTAALNRLRKFLEEDKISFWDGKGSFSLTLSGCVAEPVPGDDLNILLGNMRQDLGRYESDQGMALQYHEISALQRFVETIDK